MSRLRSGFLAVSGAVLLGFISSAAHATGGSVIANLSVPGAVMCGQTIDVTLTIDGQSPPPSLQPVDIMLVLDESGSMAGAPMNALKAAANQFIDHVDSSDGALNGNLSISRIGMVAFNNIAQLRQGLTNNTALVKGRVNQLNPGGATNISHGVDVARPPLAASSVQKVMIVMTDGQPTVANRPGDPAVAALAAATDAKNEGVQLFTIGLGSAVNTTLLTNMASSPDDYYQAPAPADLADIFQEIAEVVGGPAATSLSYSLSADPQYQLISASASAGTVTHDSISLQWSLPELNTESVTLTYTMQHVGSTNGPRSPHPTAQLSYLNDDGVPTSQDFSAAQIDVQGCNLPPMANAGPDQSLPMTGAAGAAVTLDGSASTDDGQQQPLTYTWKQGASLIGTGATFSHTFPYGVHSVTLEVFDGQYTASDEVTISVMDPIPPVTQIHETGGMGAGGWYISPVDVTLSADDNPGGSGVAQIMLSTDGGATYAPYAGAITLAAEGAHDVRAYAADVAGNVEAPGAAAVIRIDLLPPTTAATLQPDAPDGDNGWYITPVTVELAATDGQSGVNTTEYSLDGGATWHTYSGPVQFTADGIYTMLYRSTDVAGHIETASARSFQVDATGPTIDIAAPTAGVYGNHETLTLNFSATDALSGLTIISADVDGNGVTSGQVIELWQLGLGAHTLTVHATDAAGNTSAQVVTFELGVTFDGLEALKHTFYEMGWITDHGIVNSLDQKIRAARRAYERGQTHTAINIMEAFIHQVEAQRGKHINDTAATQLILSAQWLIDHM